MHELGIMTDVLDTALRAAERNGGKKVTRITLKIGLMSGVMPAYVQSFFDVIAKATIAEGAEILVEHDPAVFICRHCGEKTAYAELGAEYLCRHCGSRALRLTAGYGFQIVSVAIV
jgi:hydrogenase nickel incorporation protein HypA/HybF